MENLLTLLLLASLVCLIVGLINPKAFSRFFKGEVTKKRIGLFFGTVTLIFFILFGLIANPNKEIKEQEASRKEVQELVSISATTTKEPNLKSDQQIQDKNLYKVISVTDGDTIKVEINGKTETLRLIGIDTPETLDPRKPVQCFARESSAKAKEVLTDKNVRLESDNTQGERDKYDRLLRYVFLEDGTFYNKYMIEAGYAHEYTYQNNPYKYQSDFRAAEKSARDNFKGLWSSDTCNGDTTKADTQVPTIAPKTSPAESKVTTADPQSATTVETKSTQATPQTISSGSDSEPQVKKSKTGICHEKGSTYYNKTTNFESFDSIQDCLNSGGRLPKR